MWSVLLVFLSSLDRNIVKGNSVSSALDAKKSNKETFCTEVSSVEDKFLYVVSDGTEVVRSLVTMAGTLVNCSITGNSEQVMSFTRKCNPGHTDGTKEQQVHAPFERMDEARLLCKRFTKKFQQSNNSMDQAHRRAKRGFTYPGTLWCGAGNMADNYNQLGDFAETDSCCRTHDHCPHVIHAFSSNYGYTNFKWHSISHCDCDEALKACLRKVNHTSSRVVGQAFFNVIEVPCFDFAYEEQCVERHWYGLCKRIEKRPFAVIREAVPYDFGGIDVIDELTVAPSRKKDSNISGEKVQSEPTSQSPVSQHSNPEEPSLRNVVTAAEDFIKVLATVSTSQSSTADSDNGDTHNSEKKKKPFEKKKKSKKTKGKGRKKKKQEAMVRIEDNGAVPLSSPKDEKAMNLSNFISESQSPEQLSRPSNKVSENEYELGGREEASNEVMKDAPALDEEAISFTTPNPTKKKSAKMNFLSTLSSTTSLHKAKMKWLKNGKKKVETAPSFELQAISETSKPQDQTILSSSERKLYVNASQIDILKVKRNRSKLRKDREEREKRLKTTAAPSTAANENVADNVKDSKTLLTTTPKQQLSPEAERGRVTLLHPSFSVLKRQRHRSKEKGIAKKNRKVVMTLNEQLSQNNVEEAILPTPTGALDSPAVTFMRFTEDNQTTRKWQLFTSTTSKPSIDANGLLSKRPRKTKTNVMRGPKAMTVQRRPSKLTADPAAVTTVQSPQPTTSTANTALSPMQLTIEKVKEQFERKRKRKLAILPRHQ